MRLHHLLFLFLLGLRLPVYGQLPADSLHGTDTVALQINKYLLKLSQRKLRDEHTCSIVFRNVNVVDAAHNKVIRNCMVTELDGQIVEVRHNPLFFRKKGRKVIDGQDMYLAPGLTDMHVHFSCDNRERLQFLLYGVTGIRNLTGDPYFLADRYYISEQLLLSPRLYAAGPAIADLSSAGTVIAKTDTAAENEVKRQVAAGYDVIKLDRSLNSKALLAALKSAAGQHAHVAIELPEQAPLSQLAAFGKELSLEGFNGAAGNGEIRSVADSGVWMTPLLTATWERTEKDLQHIDYLGTASVRQRSLVQQRLLLRYNEKAGPVSSRKELFLKAYHKAGGRLLAGTESGLPVPALIPGASLTQQGHGNQGAKYRLASYPQRAAAVGRVHVLDDRGNPFTGWQDLDENGRFTFTNVAIPPSQVLFLEAQVGSRTLYAMANVNQQGVIEVSPASTAIATQALGLLQQGTLTPAQVDFAGYASDVQTAYNVLTANQANTILRVDTPEEAAQIGGGIERSTCGTAGLPAHPPATVDAHRDLHPARGGCRGRVDLHLHPAVPVDGAALRLHHVGRCR